MPNPRLRLLLLAGLGLLAGCATGSYWINVPISGGDNVPLELIPGGMVNAENDDFKVDAAVYQFDPKTSKGSYYFEFEVKRGAAPQRVKVEDVSDDAPVTLFQTDKVKLQEGHWSVRTESYTPDPQNMKWLYQIESSVRVCRFTIVTADGRSVVMYEGCNYPAFLKDLVRNDKHGGVRQAAVRELARGWRTDADTLPFLKDRARNAKHWTVRLEAVEELARGWRSDADTLPILKDRARNDQHVSVRQAAVQELTRGWRTDPETLAFLAGVKK